MTPKEKAIELYNKFRNENPVLSGNIRSKKQAYICVDEMEKVLIAYGETTFELQNMESEFRFLDKVREEIKNL